MNVALVSSSVVAIPLTLGAVYCAERFMAPQMDWLKRLVGEYIVSPHLEFFEKLSKGQTRAHEQYEAKQREKQKEQGIKPEDKKPDPTREDRISSISDTIVRTLLATVVDMGFTFASLSLLKKFWAKSPKEKMPVRITTFAGTAVQLGAIVAMPTLFARVSEDVHHTLSRLIRKITGMSKDSADNIAMPLIYVGVPGLVGLGVEGLTLNFIHKSPSGANGPNLSH